MLRGGASLPPSLPPSHPLCVCVSLSLCVFLPLSLALSLSLSLSLCVGTIPDSLAAEVAMLRWGAALLLRAEQSPRGRVHLERERVVPGVACRIGGVWFKQRSMAPEEGVIDSGRAWCLLER